MKYLLHVGCGLQNINSLPTLFHNDQWIETRYDIDESVNPDLVGTILNIELIENSSIDAVYSSHNIEHLYPHEVPIALGEFLRVLNPEGLAILLCPDIQSVALSVATGNLMGTVYTSPAGPISCIDILYGYRPSLALGNHFMAHKTGFTAGSLSEYLKDAGFAMNVVARDRLYGLHAIAYPTKQSIDRIEHDCSRIFPSIEDCLEIVHS